MSSAAYYVNSASPNLSTHCYSLIMWMRRPRASQATHTHLYLCVILTMTLKPVDAFPTEQIRVAPLLRRLTCRRDFCYSPDSPSPLTVPYYSVTCLTCSIGT